MKKFTDIVCKETVSSFETSAREAKDNAAWLERSFEIALLIVSRLRELNWKQVQLAEAMKVSPQYISKILKGRENLTLDTISLLEKILNIQLIVVKTQAIPTIYSQTEKLNFILENKMNYSVKIESTDWTRTNKYEKQVKDLDKNVITAA